MGTDVLAAPASSLVVAIHALGLAIKMVSCEFDEVNIVELCHIQSQQATGCDHSHGIDGFGFRFLQADVTGQKKKHFPCGEIETRLVGY